MSAALATRRRVLRLLAGASLLPFVACLSSSGEDGAEDDGAGDGSGTQTGGDQSCTAIPEETAGPPLGPRGVGFAEAAFRQVLTSRGASLSCL